MANLFLHLRGQDRDGAGVAVNVVDVVADVLGALPPRTPLFAAEERNGRRLFKRKGYRQKIVVQVAATTVTVSGYDFGDYRALEELLVNRDEVYIVADDTSLPRTNTTAGVDHNFWTGTNGILSDGPVQVVCTAGPELSPDFATGADKVTFTLEFVEPSL